MIKESKWSEKYKNSIDCSNPKGFSQKAHCQGLKKKKKKSSIDILEKISNVIDVLEKTGYIKEACDLHDTFVRVAKKFSTAPYPVPFPMNLDKALNKFDSKTYQVDQKGDWEEAEPISEFKDNASDKLLHSPAAIDDNHLIFYNKDEDHVEVMNMIPKNHLDTLNNPENKKWIKRAED